MKNGRCQKLDILGVILLISLEATYCLSKETFASAAMRSELPFQHCFERAAMDYSLDPNWLTAISIVESSLNPEAISTSNAIGLMQIKWPITARHLGAQSRESLFEPCFNIRLGGKYLRELLDEFNGNKRLAASAYYIGPTRLKREKKIPEEALRYLGKIEAQLAFLLPEGEGALSFQNESGPTESTVKMASKISTRQPAVGLGKETETIDRVGKVSSKTPANAKGDLEAPQCNLSRLQVSTLKTHEPLEREKNFLSWLEKNSSTCGRHDLVKIKNQIPVWLGAADTKKVRARVDDALKRSS